jgi:hypothetical protein
VRMAACIIRDQGSGIGRTVAAVSGAARPMRSAQRVFQGLGGAELHDFPGRDLDGLAGIKHLDPHLLGDNELICVSLTVIAVAATPDDERNYGVEGGR